jgi:hypothetical protein
MMMELALTKQERMTDFHANQIFCLFPASRHNGINRLIGHGVRSGRVDEGFYSKIRGTAFLQPFGKIWAGLCL